MERAFIKDYQRIVIKIGTNSIMQSKRKINYQRIDRLAYVCSTLQQAGKEVILVSSGAIGVGASTLGYEVYPTDIGEQQAVAAFGQSVLIGHYSRFFNYYNQKVAQILLTRDVIDFPESLANVRNALENLLTKNIIPIINENDAVAIDEMDHQTKFGDNDTLSSIVAKVVDAPLLIILSDVDGLYTDNPMRNPKAVKIDYVSEINDDILYMASGKGSEFSKGGMLTKIKAAQNMLEDNKTMIITSSDNPTVLFDILDGVAVGTLFKNKE
ncbi:glutamate 5-kinase [Fundicoccus culcitae]|uniref:Glutamate 5-kinase n=1 Tax=Fundicoccus culcitae TaxID=2969821 RepID=A0ABY5P3I4_9LACT|nr:glutamate 5-kinase [Fundicoccus culcitae]UUX33065.1 glutamate 5-kinase [Fundicoccus culcitae]